MADDRSTSGWYLESYRPESTEPELHETIQTFEDLAIRIQELFFEASDRILRVMDQTGLATREQLQQLSEWNIEPI